MLVVAPPAKGSKTISPIRQIRVNQPPGMPISARCLILRRQRRMEESLRNTVSMRFFLSGQQEVVQARFGAKGRAVIGVNPAKHEMPVFEDRLDPLD